RQGRGEEVERREGGGRGVGRERGAAPVPAVAQRQLPLSPRRTGGALPRRELRDRVVQVRIARGGRARNGPRRDRLPVIRRQDRAIRQERLDEAERRQQGAHGES